MSLPTSAPLDEQLGFMRNVNSDTKATTKSCSKAQLLVQESRDIVDRITRSILQLNIFHSSRFCRNHRPPALMSAPALSAVLQWTVE